MPSVRASSKRDKQEQIMTFNSDAAVNRNKPSLMLSAEDYERLSALADAMPDLAAELADEIGRARVLAKGEQVQDTVRMNSQVKFRDDTTNVIREVTLVYPHEADIDLGKISVMTPIGSALIGVPAGQSITWETRGGETKQLTVLAVA
jgi:regulator of nucleoside diphosphate kinase